MGGGTGDAIYDATSGLPPHQACPTWELIDTATPEDPAVGAGVLTLGTSDDAENMYYIQRGADLLTPATLVIEAEMALVSGSSSSAHRGPMSVAFTTASDFKKNVLSVADGEIFILAAENTKGPSASVPTTDDFHTYRIEVDTTTGAVTVFYDGTQTLTGSTYPAPATTENRIRFGDASLLAHGVGEWKTVRHNAHVAPCP